MGLGYACRYKGLGAARLKVEIEGSIPRLQPLVTLLEQVIELTRRL